MTTLRYSNSQQNEILDKMYAAAENKTAQPLTLDAAKSLKGKRIQTIYFGYKGQDGINDFIVGDLVPQQAFFTNPSQATIDRFIENHGEVLELTNEFGKATAIRCHLTHGYYADIFTCSDIDRIVYYTEVKTAGTENALDSFFQKVEEEKFYPFMAAKIYGHDENEEKAITEILKELNINNPYPSDYHYNELRHRYFLWSCVNTTNRLIAEGKEITEANPTEWRKWA